MCTGTGSREPLRLFFQRSCEPGCRIGPPRPPAARALMRRSAARGRHVMRETQEGEASQVELFLNSVPLLASLSREEKLALVDAVDKQVFAPGVRVINQVRACSRRARAPGR